MFKFVCKLLALPFLPSEHIQETFQRLDEGVPRPLLQWWTMSTGHGSVVKYSRSITGVSSWQPSEQKWHVGIAQHTCTKDSRGPVAFYQLVKVLYGEAADIKLNMMMVSEGKLQRYQRKRPRQMEDWVFSLWQQYCQRNINTSQLLQGSTSIYGPPAQWCTTG